MEVVKIENATEEAVTDSLSTVKVDIDGEYIKQMTVGCNISKKEAGLESIKCERNINKEENNTYGGDIVNIKLESTEIKYEVNIEHDPGQYVDYVEGVEVDKEKENALQDRGKCIYETGDTARHNNSKPNIEQHQFFLPIYKTEDESELQTHINVTNEANVKYFKCQFCEFITKNIYRLKRHFTTKHCENAELYHCYNCKHKTKFKDNLAQHCRLHHDKRTKWHQCHSCNFKTKYKGNMLQHQISKHDHAAAIFHCKLCDFNTKSKRHLYLHHRSKHDDAAETFLCKMCDYKTKRKCKLLEHHRLRHDEAAEIFHCKLCDFKTKYKQNLLLHNKSKHNMQLKSSIVKCVITR